MKQLLILSGVVFFLFGAKAPGWGQSTYKNIVIERYNGKGFQPCEPSIAIDVNDPSIIVGGAILDKVYTSQDSGKTWSIDRLKSRYGVYGDPCIVSSPKGSFHFLHLSDPTGQGWANDSLLDRIVINNSFDKGKTWDEGYGIGLDPPRDQDKEWACTDAKGKYLYVTWTEFDKYASEAPGDSTYIRFSRGNSKGTEWTEPIRLNKFAGNCLDGDATVEGAVPCAGHKKDVYVAWALNDTIWFDRSDDNGQTWLEQDIPAAIIAGGWDQKIPGINRTNGMPVTAYDRSGGEHDGRIYINWTDQRNGEDDTDVFITWSDDHGDTWVDPVRVNDDGAGSHQFFTWLALDQSTGFLYTVFYDRRNYDDLQTDVYLAYSEDGGQTWTNERISEKPFIPSESVFFGDYNNISAVNGVIRPIWTRCDDRRLSVWTALINRP